MIVILKSGIARQDAAYAETLDYLGKLEGINLRIHEVEGAVQTLTEIYLIGDTHKLDKAEIESLESVDRVIKISEEYRILGRHKDQKRATGFTYNGVEFNQDNFHIFAGLCAVDTPEHVEMMMKTLRDHGQTCTRMGAYKPRTNPYSFQGHGKSCLPWVFELAGKYDIKIIAMEVTHDSHVEEIVQELEKAGNPTGVMLQIGTRNTQNFELLKAVGRQNRFPVLFKGGYGVSLNESLNAAEYLASEGNANVIYCLRGIKAGSGNPHRNMVDFAHVPVVKRLTRIPVCIDPSHSVGTREISPDGILDLVHAAAQGVISGANMILVDFHPHPASALVDGPQAMLLQELPLFLEDMQELHKVYKRRVDLWN